MFSAPGWPECFDTSSTREAAEEFIARMKEKYLAEAAQSKANLAAPEARTASAELDGARLLDVLEDFCKCVEATSRHKALLKTLKRLVGNPTIGQLAPSWIKSYILRAAKFEWAVGRCYSLGSIASQLSVVGVAIKWKAEELDIQPRAFIVKDKYFKDVARALDLPLVDGNWRTRRTRRLEDGEEEKLMTEMAKISGPKGEQWQLFFQWAIETAGRQKELALAKWSDISPASLTWNIPHYKTKARSMSITDAGREILDTLRSGPVKPGKEVRIFPLVGEPAKVSRDFRQMVYKAGIENLKFHDLRHEGISRFVISQTMSIDRIMQMVGHTDPATTEIYINLRQHEIERLMVRNAVIPSPSPSPPSPSPAAPPSRQPSYEEGARDGDGDGDADRAVEEGAQPA